MKDIRNAFKGCSILFTKAIHPDLFPGSRNNTRVVQCANILSLEIMSQLGSVKGPGLHGRLIPKTTSLDMLDASMQDIGQLEWWTMKRSPVSTALVSLSGRGICGMQNLNGNDRWTLLFVLRFCIEMYSASLIDIKDLEKSISCVELLAVNKTTERMCFSFGSLVEKSLDGFSLRNVEFCCRDREMKIGSTRFSQQGWKKSCSLDSKILRRVCEDDIMFFHDEER